VTFISRTDPEGGIDGPAEPLFDFHELQVHMAGPLALVVES
jgi:hypothetical protein